MAMQRILQNNLLLWVDANINHDNVDTQHTLQKLRTIVNHIDLFNQIDDCLRFLKKVKNEQALVITSGSLGQDLVGKIHQLPQVDAIYIFCGNPDRHETWAKEWPKIKGVYNRIKPICDALRSAVKQTNEDLTPMSFIESIQDGQDGSIVDLNRLEPSFMYTTLFKRIFLHMKHEPQEKEAIIQFCRRHYANNPRELKLVEEFQRNYRPDKAIWWYTRECFTYQILNRSLRLLESDIIVDMGFFIHDIHCQLEKLHREQSSNNNISSLTVYRGQALSFDDFSKLQKSRGGLLAFNSFLSTSKNREISLDFARKAAKRQNMVGIFFVMTIDPRIRSATFADVQQHSHCQTESEILFTMHTVFRIHNVLQLQEKPRLFEVRAALTSDDDPELRHLTDRIEEGIGGETGWERLGHVLIDVGQVNKAEELYLALLAKNPSERDQGLYYHSLGLIKDRQGNYKMAVKYYKQAIRIKEKILSPTDTDLATSYNNIGGVYMHMEAYSKALSYYSKALAIDQKILRRDDPRLAISYNNIGLLYSNNGEYSKALPYLEKALTIDRQILPDNHPDLATSYNNIGLLYSNMEDYSIALSYHTKAISIDEKTLPDNHPDLATSYNNIGSVYSKMKQYSEALLYYEKALVIREKILPPNHPSLANSYNNIGFIYYKLNQYSEAKMFFEKAYDIWQCSLPSEHISIRMVMKSLELVNEKIQKCSN